MAQPRPPTVASLALAEALQDAALAESLEARIHRTMLWRWSTGRAQPDLERAFLVEALTEGRVKAKDWTVLAPEAPALAATGS